VRPPGQGCAYSCHMCSHWQMRLGLKIKLNLHTVAVCHHVLSLDTARLPGRCVQYITAQVPQGMLLSCLL